MTGQRRAEREAENHHDPDDGRRRRAARWRDLGRQHRQDRGAGGPDADADEEEGKRGKRDAENRLARRQRRRQCGAKAAKRQRRHAADDPGRAPSTHVGAVAPGRAQGLHAIVERHERAGDERRQCELDRHDAIDRRGHDDDDGAQGGLNQAQAKNAGPAKAFRYRCGRPRLHDANVRSAFSSVKMKLQSAFGGGNSVKLIGQRFVGLAQRQLGASPPPSRPPRP